MPEYSRILIEEYCMKHNSAKSRRLQKLVELSYDVAAEGTESDAIFLEKRWRISCGQTSLSLTII